MDTAPISGASIVKRLASCNKTTRDRAIRLLSSWLPQQSSAVDSLTDGDLMKIWKGIFYCVWHADKLPSQLDLINRLSSLLETLDPQLSIRYFESFLITIRREWSGIDFLRLDKFYLLIRKFIHRFFGLLKKNDWNLNLLNRLVGVLMEKSLLADDKFQAGGVNYHIAEVFLDEFEGFLPIKPETLDLLLRPFVLVLERSSDRVLVNKVKVNVFDRFLNGEVDKFGKFALVLGFSDKLFKSASDSETVQGNRKVLFGLHERFLKLEKDLERSGMEISFEVEKVKSLGTETVDGDGGSDVRPVKRRKKEKKAYNGIEKKSKTKKKKKEESDSAADCNGVENKSKSNKKKKKKKLADSAVESNNEEDSADAIGESPDRDVMVNSDLLTFDESVISNLQKQFEKVAAETGMDLPTTPVNIMVMKKRKRAKSSDRLATVSNGESTAGKSRDKSVKKVRFSMKNNLFWKPTSPLPPQSLRLPPSATPRGSALKKGVPPGPVRETPPTVKRIKAKGSSVKKGRKNLKSVSPAVKRLRMLQSLSV